MVHKTCHKIYLRLLFLVTFVTWSWPFKEGPSYLWNTLLIHMPALWVSLDSLRRVQPTPRRISKCCNLTFGLTLTCHMTILKCWWPLGVSRWELWNAASPISLRRLTYRIIWGILLPPPPPIHQRYSIETPVNAWLSMWNIKSKRSKHLFFLDALPTYWLAIDSLHCRQIMEQTVRHIFKISAYPIIKYRAVICNGARENTFEKLYTTRNCYIWTTLGSNNKITYSIFANRCLSCHLITFNAWNNVNWSIQCYG